MNQMVLSLFYFECHFWQLFYGAWNCKIALEPLSKIPFIIMVGAASLLLKQLLLDIVNNKSHC